MKRVVLATAILMVVFLAVSLAQMGAVEANPYHREEDWTEVPPPAGTQAPILVIRAPQNGSYYPKNVNLTLDVIIPNIPTVTYPTYSVSELYYVGSWKPNEVTYIEKNFGVNSSFSIDLAAVPGGNLSITVYAVGVGFYVTSQELESDTFTMITHFATFKMNSHSTVSFIKDLVPPGITVQSPQNTTYSSSEVTLDFKVNEGVSQILYTLDNKGNQTISGNFTLTDLLNGEHTITLYVADLAGNAADPKTINFSVDLPKPFPNLLVTVIVALVAVVVVVVSLLFYRRHRKTSKFKFKKSSVECTNGQQK